MCTSPLRISNKSVYYVGINQPSNFEVPCGRCLECRSVAMSEWQTRLSYEISDLYLKRKGVAVFLTFTYNDNHLPTFTYNGKVQSCFNRKDVLTFLNRLKVTIYRAYGKGSYKYFFTSEYGKNTKRPHYHALFFLEKNVNVVDFCETARRLWTYGFMFPKYNHIKHCYVDNYGRISQVTIKSLFGGAKYVSKYITKDLSFYNLPIVAQYSDSDSCDKNHLPKHWQSNKLGYSILDNIKPFQLDEDYISHVLSKGVLNPLTKKYIPLPRYVVNHLMYQNVRTNRLGINGQHLYDRVLSTFGKAYMRTRYFSLFDKKLSDFTEFLHNIGMYENIIHEFGYVKFYDYVKLLLSCEDSLALRSSVVNYMLAYRFVSYNDMMHYLVKNGGDLDFLKSVDFASNVYTLSKDTQYFKDNYNKLSCDNVVYQYPISFDLRNRLHFLECIVHFYSHIISKARMYQCEHYKRLNDASDKMRMWFNAFPNYLC